MCLKFKRDNYFNSLVTTSLVGSFFTISVIVFSRKKLVSALHTSTVESNNVIQMKIEIVRKNNYYIETGKLKQTQI